MIFIIKLPFKIKIILKISICKMIQTDGLRSTVFNCNRQVAAMQHLICRCAPSNADRRTLSADPGVTTARCLFNYQVTRWSFLPLTLLRGIDFQIGFIFFKNFQKNFGTQTISLCAIVIFLILLACSSAAFVSM